MVNCLSPISLLALLSRLGKHLALLLDKYLLPTLALSADTVAYASALAGSIYGYAIG